MQIIWENMQISEKKDEIGILTVTEEINKLKNKFFVNWEKIAWTALASDTSSRLFGYYRILLFVLIQSVLETTQTFFC